MSLRGKHTSLQLKSWNEPGGGWTDTNLSRSIETETHSDGLRARYRQHAVFELIDVCLAVATCTVPG